MDDQLALSIETEVKRTRVTVVDPETFEHGKTYLDGPGGCLTCHLQHDGERWTNRGPKPHVYLLGSKRDGGLYFCPDHIEAAINERRRARERRCY